MARVRPPRFVQRQGGQAIVEIALLLPMLLLIAMCAVGGGELMSTSIALRNGAREGALAAAAYTANASNAQANVCPGSGSAQACAQARVAAEGALPAVIVTVTSGTAATSGIPIVSAALSTTVRPAQNFFGPITLSYTAVAAVP